MSINLTKTKYMLIKHTKVNHEPHVKIGEYKISTVSLFKYLGMALDDKLTMNHYLDSMWKKTNAKIGILTKIRRFITEKTAVRIYKCMVRPHLDYIDFLVDSGSADRIKKLNKLQEKATRRIEYCKKKKKKSIFHNPIRGEKNLVKIMYSQSTNDQNLKIDVVETNLRSKSKVKMKNDFTSKTRVFNPLYRGLRLWDSLPGDLQKEKDNRTFKKKIPKHYFK